MSQVEKTQPGATTDEWPHDGASVCGSHAGGGKENSGKVGGPTSTHSDIGSRDAVSGKQEDGSLPATPGRNGHLKAIVALTTVPLGRSTAIDAAAKPAAPRAPLRPLGTHPDPETPDRVRPLERLRRLVSSKRIGEEIYLEGVRFIVCVGQGRRYLQRAASHSHLSEPPVSVEAGRAVPPADAAPQMRPPGAAAPADPMVEPDMPREDVLSLSVKLCFLVCLLSLDGNMLTTALMVLISCYVLLSHLGLFARLRGLFGRGRPPSGRGEPRNDWSAMLRECVLSVVSFFTCLIPDAAQLLD